MAPVRSFRRTSSSFPVIEEMDEEDDPPRLIPSAPLHSPSPSTRLPPPTNSELHNSEDGQLVAELYSKVIQGLGIFTEVPSQSNNVEDMESYPESEPTVQQPTNRNPHLGRPAMKGHSTSQLPAQKLPVQQSSPTQQQCMLEPVGQPAMEQSYARRVPIQKLPSQQQSPPTQDTGQQSPTIRRSSTHQAPTQRYATESSIQRARSISPDNRQPHNIMTEQSTVPIERMPESTHKVLPRDEESPLTYQVTKKELFDISAERELMDSVIDESPSNSHQEMEPGPELEMELEPEKPDTFPKFLVLPSNIRERVWELNLPGPRLVEVVEWQGDFYGSVLLIVNLSVCRESRYHALKTHPLSFSVDYAPPLIPFNFEMDTLFLGQRLNNDFTQFNVRENNHIFFRKKCDANDLAKVRGLMVDAELSWGKHEWINRNLEIHDRGRQSFGGLSTLIFRGVREYTALYTGLTDPLPWWKYRDWIPELGWRSRHRDADILDDYRTLKNNWLERYGYPRFRATLSKSEREQFRFGGIPEHFKWDPAIRRWEIPKVSSLGVREDVLEAIRRSSDLEWPLLLMDRAIDDMFD